MKKPLDCIVVLFTILTFNSCSAFFTTSAPDEIKKIENKRQVDIMKIYTSGDGLINFSNKYPGKLSDGMITGVKQVPLKLFSSDSVSYRIRGPKELPLFAYSDGRKYEVFKHNDLDYVYTSTLIKVPVSEVSNIEYKREGNRTVILAGLITGVSAMSIFIISNISFNVADAF